MLARRVWTRVSESVTSTCSCNLALLSFASDRFAALVKRIVTSLVPEPVIVTRFGIATAEPFRVRVRNPVQAAEQLTTTLTPDLRPPGSPSALGANALVESGPGMISGA